MPAARRPQGSTQFFRNSPVEISAVGIAEDARSGAARPRRRSAKHLRRTKLVAAFALTVLVGVGSYAGTYRALVLVSEPAGATGSVAPLSPGGTGAVHAPVTSARTLP
jgi:hypothetical protein